MLYFFPGDLTLDGIGTHQNLRLSAYDVEYLSKIYPNGIITPEEFYKQVYGESLEKARQDSYKYSNKRSFNTLIIVGSIILGIIIIGFIIWLINKNKTMGGKKKKRN